MLVFALQQRAWEVWNYWWRISFDLRATTEDSINKTFKASVIGNKVKTKKTSTVPPINGWIHLQITIFERVFNMYQFFKFSQQIKSILIYSQNEIWRKNPFIIIEISPSFWQYVHFCSFFSKRMSSTRLGRDAQLKVM